MKIKNTDFKYSVVPWTESENENKTLMGKLVKMNKSRV